MDFIVLVQVDCPKFGIDSDVFWRNVGAGYMDVSPPEACRIEAARAKT